MSKLVDFFYKTPEKREMPKGWRTLYVLLGIGAAALLITAYYDTAHPLLHQLGTTICFFFMILINAIHDIRKKGVKQYLFTNFRKDFGILVIWVILLIIWIMFPEAPKFLED